MINSRSLVRIIIKIYIIGMMRNVISESTINSNRKIKIKIILIRMMNIHKNNHKTIIIIGIFIKI
jgi:hypothetical protein